MAICMSSRFISETTQLISMKFGSCGGGGVKELRKNSWTGFISGHNSAM